MTLAERKAALLTAAMALSKERQDLTQRLNEVEQELLKAAGAIDLVTKLIAESEPSLGK